MHFFFNEKPSHCVLLAPTETSEPKEHYSEQKEKYRESIQPKYILVGNWL